MINRSQKPDAAGEPHAEVKNDQAHIIAEMDDFDALVRAIQAAGQRPGSSTPTPERWSQQRRRPLIQQHH